MNTTDIKPFEHKQNCTGHALRQSWSSYLAKTTRKNKINELNLFWINIPHWVKALDANQITLDDFKYCILNGPFYNERLSGILGVLGRVCADRNIFPDLVRTVFETVTYLDKCIDTSIIRNAININPLSNGRLLQHATALFDGKNDNGLGESVAKQLISTKPEDLAIFLDKIKYADDLMFSMSVQSPAHAMVVAKHQCVFQLKYSCASTNPIDNRIPLLEVYMAYARCKDVLTREEDFEFKLGMLEQYSRYFVDKISVDANTVLSYINSPIPQRKKLQEQQIITIDTFASDYPEHKNLIELSKSLDSLKPLRSLLVSTTDDLVDLPELN